MTKLRYKTSWCGDYYMCITSTICIPPKVGIQDGQLTVLSNGDDITSDLQSVNDSVSGSLGQARRADQHTVVLVSPHGISVNISIRNGLLDYVVALPESFKGTTRGLLGNFNGNPDDDLMSPDGSQTLGSNATDAQIHSLGQECMYHYHHKHSAFSM